MSRRSFSEDVCLEFVSYLDIRVSDFFIREVLMIHNVFFTLNDASAAAVKKLIDDCYKYLKDIDGVVFFAAGERVRGYQRPVNDQQFDVALHIAFKSKEDHDKYQTSENHQAFIAANKPNWKSLKVCDSFIAG